MKTFFDRNPNAFRLVFAVFATLAVIGVARHVFNLLNAGSSDNTFQTSASRLYVTKDIPALRLVRVQDSYLTFQRRNMGLIRRGDLVTRIAGVRVETSADAYEALVHLDGPVVEIEVQRPTKKGFFISFEIAAQELPENFIWEIPPTVYVWAVPTGGASDRAGLKAGDLIHEINGQTFRDQTEADALVANLLRGETAVYGVIRQGEFFEVAVTMASLTIPMSLVLYLIVAVAWLFFGIFLVVFKANLKAARLLGLGMTAFGCWLVLSEGGGSRLLTDFFDHTMGTVAFFLGVGLLMHASFYFPRDRDDLLARPWQRYAVYPIMLAGIALALIFGRTGQVAGFLLLFLPFMTLRFRYRRGRSAEHRKLDQWIVLGSVLALFSFGLWFALADRVPQTWHLTLRAFAAGFLLLCYAGTIVRYRLLGLRMRRGIQYLMVMVVWGAILLIGSVIVLRWLSATDLQIFNINFTPTNIEVLDQPISPEQRFRREKFFLMILAIGFGFLVYGLGSAGFRFLQRKFHRSGYDDRRATKELTELLTTQRHLDSLARGVVERLARMMMIKRVGLLVFREESRLCCREAFGFDASQWRTFCDRAGSRVAETLKRFRCELRVEYLAPALKEHLLADEFRYLTPVYAGERLVGCVMVGEKKSEATYRQQDFLFLEEKARQIGVAIENALLYERLSEQDRLRHELTLARRIQLSSLPQTLPDVAGLDVAGLSRPAFEVGGDYYAYFPEGQSELTVILGDVSGKGTSAALYMSKMQGVFSSLYDPGVDLCELFIKANRVLAQEMEKKSFATASCVRFQPQRQQAHLVRAGHVPLMVYRHAGDVVDHVLPQGLALGIGLDGVFERILEQRTIDYAPRDVFLLFSDGLSEAFNPEGEAYGEDRIAKVLAACAHLPAREIRDHLMDAVASFARDAEQHDDQTLVVIKADSLV